MYPAIVHPPGQPENAYLVDLHSVANAEGPAGKPAQLALHAVNIGSLRAGEITIDPDTGHVRPAPCILASWEAFEVKDPLWRGIYPDAAEAMLRMPLGLKTDIAPGKDFKMDRPAKGFDKWKFLTAWAWSLWQAKERAGESWPLERRWQEMKIIGYAGGFGTFRQLCSRLGLSVTKSGPYL